MLRTLRLKNVGIIEDLEIDFGAGMNVLTGETGAGKSLVLRGLSLLAGGKASADIVRHGTNRAEVEGIFQIPAEAHQEISDVHEWIQEVIQDDELILRRIVDESGRGKIYIGGRLSTRGELEALAPSLLEITGQHAQQRLLDESEHLRFLDDFGTPDELLREMRITYERYSSARKSLEQFLNALSTEQETARRLQLEAEELGKAKLKAGEKDELLRELKKLSAVEMLGGTCSEVIGLIENEEFGISHLISKAVVSLERALKEDAEMGEIVSLARQSQAEIEELLRGLNAYYTRLEADPDRAEWIRERCSEIAKLERRYARPEEQLVAHFEEIQRTLAKFENKEEEERRLRMDAEKAREQLVECELKLTAIRAKNAKKLERKVEGELKAVGITKGIFNVALTTGSSTEQGNDLATFKFTANPGEPTRPISQVASGGELSRLLLVLKAILQGKRASAVQVFDEIDTGVGGATARMVGERIKSISNLTQVILVTHAPQIASMADSHFEISKKITGSRTTVSIEKLQQERRVQEVARMLAGKQISANFVDSARELLAGG